MNTSWNTRPHKDCLQLTPGFTLDAADREYLSRLPEADRLKWYAAAIEAQTPLRQLMLVLMLDCFENEPGTDGELSPSEARMIEFTRAVDLLPEEHREDLSEYCEAVLRANRSR